MKEIIYRSAARKALRKMPRNWAERIISKIEDYATDPNSQANNTKKLQGRDGIRLRVGDYRVIMQDGIVLDVLDIGARGQIYR